MKYTFSNYISLYLYTFTNEKILVFAFFRIKVRGCFSDGLLEKVRSISKDFYQSFSSPKQRIKQSNTMRTFADWVRCAVVA